MRQHFPLYNEALVLYTRSLFALEQLLPARRINHLKLNNRGFTLIEVIVVAAIIAILAGILVPMIFNQIDESKVSKANGDIKAIQTAVLSFRKDIGRWPVVDLTSGDQSANVLASAGNIPALPAGFTAVGPHGGELFSTRLSSDAKNQAVFAAGGLFEKTWKGPYLAAFTADPWGNAYVMNSGYLFYTETDAVGATTAPVWIISAGPNGTYETDITHTSLQGDDIGVRIR